MQKNFNRIDSMRVIRVKNSFYYSTLEQHIDLIIVPMLKRKCVTLNTKLDIVRALDEGLSIRAVTSEIGVSKGTVQPAKKNLGPFWQKQKVTDR